MTTVNKWLATVLCTIYQEKARMFAAQAKEDSVLLSLPNKMRILIYANISSLWLWKELLKKTPTKTWEMFLLLTASIKFEYI